MQSVGPLAIDGEIAQGHPPPASTECRNSVSHIPAGSHTRVRMSSSNGMPANRSEIQAKTTKTPL